MIYSLFNSLITMLNSSLIISLFAVVLWGVMSIILSPCHLATIPIFVSYLINKKGDVRSPIFLSTIFVLGLFLSFILMGAITLMLGRIFGDVGILGNIILAVIFTVFGLYLTGLVKFDFRFNIGKKDKYGLFALGFFYGIGLGPCTFAYIAPIFGVVFNSGSHNIIKPILLILFFSISHCFTLIILSYYAYKSGKLINNLLGENKIKYANIFIGIVFLFVGGYYIYETFAQ